MVLGGLDGAVMEMEVYGGWKYFSSSTSTNTRCCHKESELFGLFLFFWIEDFLLIQRHADISTNRRNFVDDAMSIILLLTCFVRFSLTSA